MARGGQKRKPGLPRKAKERDGYICQCCGRPCDEGHHIHPLVFDGPDELNNVITLCGLCHKHSPNNPAEFLDYQKQGGEFIRRYRSEWRAEFVANVIKEASRKGEAIPDDASIDQRFEETFQELRLNLYGYVPTEALQLGVTKVVKQFEDNERDRNDAILLNDKELAEKRMSYFSQFKESDFAFEKANKMATHIINIKGLRERYGYTAEMQEQMKIEADKQQATQALTFQPPYRNNELRNIDTWAGCAKSWSELIDKHLEAIGDNRTTVKWLQPYIQKGTVESFNEAYKITCGLDLLAAKSLKSERWVWVSLCYAMAVSRRLDAIDHIGSLDAYLQSNGGCIKYAPSFVPDEVLDHARTRRQRHGDKAGENTKALFRRAFDWAQIKLEHLHCGKPDEVAETKKLTLAIQSTIHNQSNEPVLCSRRIHQR